MLFNLENNLPTIITKTSRLQLREVSFLDTDFIIKLFNQPDFLRFIGDRDIGNKKAAENYIQDNFINSYIQYNYGLYAVELLSNHSLIGLCGLVKRDHLHSPDIGFAFLEEYQKNGYAFEACNAVLSLSKQQNISPILAIVMPENIRCIQLLTKLGMRFERSIFHSNEMLNVFCTVE